MKNLFRSLIENRKGMENKVLSNVEMKWLFCYFSDVKTAGMIQEMDEASIMEALPYEEYAQMCEMMLN